MRFMACPSIGFGFGGFRLSKKGANAVPPQSLAQSHLGTLPKGYSCSSLGSETRTVGFPGRVPEFPAPHTVSLGGGPI
jgi:hypothetical protein